MKIMDSNTMGNAIDLDEFPSVKESNLKTQLHEHNDQDKQSVADVNTANENTTVLELKAEVLRLQRTLESLIQPINAVATSMPELNANKYFVPNTNLYAPSQTITTTDTVSVSFPSITVPNQYMNKYSCASTSTVWPLPASHVVNTPNASTLAPVIFSTPECVQKSPLIVPNIAVAATSAEYAPYMQNRQDQTNVRMQYETNMNSNVAMAMHSASNYCNIREIIDALPSFDNNSDDVTSVQFVQSVEQLKNAYQWNDHIVLFAIRSKLRGAAKLWIDSQPVFRSWGEFVVAFLNDFPCVLNAADIHMQLMSNQQRKNESVVEYYYRMLAIGRRGQLEDQVVIRYVTIGLYDDGLRKTLSAMQFKNCSDFVRSLQNSNVSVRRPVVRYNDNQYMPNKNNSDSSVTRVVKTGPVCYNCREYGHISKNCPKPQRKPRCSMCSGNHDTKTCNKRNPVNAIEKPGVIIKQICINNILCNALIDSGSGVSIIKHNIAIILKCKLIKCVKTLNGFAGGEYVCSEKTDKLSITIDEQRYKCEMLVVEDDTMAYDVIIGIDLLSKCRVVIENGNCQVFAITPENFKCNKNLSVNEQNELRNLLNNYNDCFGENLNELGKAKTTKMEIAVTSPTPITKKPYSIPIPKQRVVERIVDELLELNIIRTSTSEYSAPIVLVPKSNGEDRLCIDYRALNAVTEKQPWSMPTVDGVLSTLAEKRFFTTLDMMSGYYQIEIAESSKKLTAFVTHNGHYEFNRMPFGLKNAPCVFQKMMMKLMEPLRGKVVSYVDEVIVASETAQEGLENLGEFLKIIRNEGLTLRLSKCYFMKGSVSFLGHEVDENGIKPGITKTIAIKQFPIPTNVTEVRRFLGLTGYFRKFVQNYAQIAHPLTQLTRKNIAFKWSLECENAFLKLIELLANEPLLGIYDINKEHEIYTDASSIGLAAILMQREDNGISKPIAYFSRLCTDVESKYHGYELEVLAVVEACQRFRMYLLGKHFKIFTDCSAISSIKTVTPMIPRVARWLLKLLEYDYTSSHRPGNLMAHVDAMSRAPVEPPCEVDDVSANLMMIDISNEDWILTMQQQDANLQQIIDILKGRVDSTQREQHEKEFILKGSRLYRRHHDGKELMVIPKGIRWRIVKLCHDDAGHPGVDGTIKRIKQHFWFPRCRNFVKGYIKSCIECCYNRSTAKKECQLHGMEIPRVPFEVIHMDHLGPFIRSCSGNEYIIVIVDALTRYVVTVAVKSTKTKPVLETLNQLTLYFGLPSKIVTDRGTAFTSSAFEAYCNSNNIQHIKVAVRTPRANGIAERVNQSILSYLKTSSDTKDWDTKLRCLQWKINTTINSTTKYSPIELIYDFPLKDISGNKLLAAVTEENINIDGHELSARREDAKKNIKAAREVWKARFDAKYKTPQPYKEGDLVLIEATLPSTGESRKLGIKYRGPYEVKKILRFDRYVIGDMVGEQRKQRRYSTVVSSDKLKPWCSLFPTVDDDYDEDNDINI